MSTDSLTRGVAFWLAEHYNADEWDCLTGDEKAGYLGQAEELLRYVAEPLSEVSARPGPAVTAAQVARVVEQLREEAQLPGPGAHVRGLREAFHDAADLVERELGVSVPASPTDDGNRTRPGTKRSVG